MKQFQTVFLATIVSTISALAVSAQNSPNNVDRLLFSDAEVSEAVIRQEIAPFAPLNSAAVVVVSNQRGNQNNADIAVTGQGLLLSVAQSGNQNLMEVGLTGLNSTISLLQNGSFNEMTLTNVTANGVNFTAEQHQDANVLRVDGNQSGSLPNLTIRQSGGMQLTISGPADFVIR